jgi:hypothetical protein
MAMIFNTGALGTPLVSPAGFDTILDAARNNDLEILEGGMILPSYLV